MEECGRNRYRWLGFFTSIRIACDVDNQLLGHQGATAQYGPQRVCMIVTSKFEEQIKEILNIIESHRIDIFELSKVKGSGAAGGIGFGLSIFYEVSLVHGFDLISSWFEIDQKIEEADYVITGEDLTKLLSGKGRMKLSGFQILKRHPPWLWQVQLIPKLQEISKFYWL